MPAETAAEALRKTSLYDVHVAHGARIVPFAGWSMPVQYENLVKEHHAVRSGAGLFDASHMGELHLSGEHALAVVDYLVTNDIKSASAGQAVYTVCLNERGTILDDLIIYKSSDTKLMVVCNASNREKISAHFRKAAEHHCEFRDASDETALIALQGPKAFDILRAAQADDAVLGLKPFFFTEGSVAGIRATVARTGYTGEDGVELFCAWNEAPKLWAALNQAGAVPCGLGCRDTLRLEARLSLYGNDIDEATNPLEAGLGWVVKWNKGDFVGRTALEQIKAAGVTRKMVGIEMVGRGIARHGYPIVDAAGAPIGVITSGSPSPTLEKNIALGYVPATLAEVGTRLNVDVRGKHVEAVVVKTPFYKRSK